MNPNIDPNELLSQFLNDQTAAHAEGLGTTLPEGLVLPFEDTPLRPLDARSAWQDALAVAGLFPGVRLPEKLTVPPGWSDLLLSLDATADVPFALGNFPQRVRNLSLLLRREITAPTGAGDRPELTQWALSLKEPLAKLLAAGVLRLVGDLEAAKSLLSGRFPADLAALHANEAATLAWQSGQQADALTAWRSQPESPAVLFNRGLASLFLAEIDAARVALDAARAALPESGAWHHLASVYRVMVELD